MRRVEKAICILRATRVDATPLLLTYKSDDWGMSLFPNVNLAPESKDDNRIISALLAERLGINPSQVTLTFDRFNAAASTRTVKQTADPQKAAKYGSDAEYLFHYAEVKVADPPSHFVQRMFRHRDTTWVWRSLPSLKSDVDVRKHNSDALEYLSRTYDQTLVRLPEAFAERIQHGALADEDRFDLFVSYAFEDQDFAEPLAQSLSRSGLVVWYDKFVLNVGDSLRDAIDRGLARSAFGAIVLSPSFFEKKWAQRELDGMVALATQGRTKLLPVWHKIDAAALALVSPSLAGLVAARSDEGLVAVTSALRRAMGL